MSATSENGARHPAARVARPDRAGGRLLPVTGPLAAPIACGCCLAAAAAYVAATDPSDGGVFVPCPFRTLTGWWCPGCGLTRATHHLLRGDLLQALRFNAFVVVVLSAVVWSWSRWMRAAARGRPAPPVNASPWLVVPLVAVAVLFAVIRNLPPFQVLRG